MHGHEAAVQSKKNIFTLAIDRSNAAALSMAGEIRSRLRLGGNGMKNMHAKDSSALDKRAERADDCFYFREFGHKRRTGSRTTF